MVLYNNSRSPLGREIDLTYCGLINANYRVATSQLPETTHRQRKDVNTDTVKRDAWTDKCTKRPKDIVIDGQIDRHERFSP